VQSVGADLCAKHWNRPSGGALCGGTAGPRHTVGRSATWHRSNSSSAYVRTVHDGVEGLLLRSRPTSHLLRGAPSGRRDPKVCLGVGRLPKTSLVDIESKRDEDLR
jgi:hypothetical protein